MHLVVDNQAPGPLPEQLEVGIGRFLVRPPGEHLVGSHRHRLDNLVLARVLPDLVGRQLRLVQQLSHPLVDGRDVGGDCVGNAIKAIPISKSEKDGYTEIGGLRQATQIDITKNNETNITILTTLQSAADNIVENVSTIELDVNGFPVKITTNEVECVINWEGF